MALLPLLLLLFYYYYYYYYYYYDYYYYAVNGYAQCEWVWALGMGMRTVNGYG